MKKVIAIDFDGVIADTGAVKSLYLKSQHHVDLEPSRCRSANYRKLIGDQACDLMAQTIYGRDVTLTIPAMMGVHAAIEKLASSARLFVLTARNASQALAIPQWLNLQGMSEYFEEVRFLDDEQSKLQVCDEIGADTLIDDYDKHLRTQSSERLLILYGSDEVPAEAPYVPAQDWAEVLRVIGI
ncbi:MAG: hypothetical protein KDD62_01390 [Bdellovibrionales bacterium]|nr:hypothetical protein [Bdellovibrionales bacterium]